MIGYKLYFIENRYAFKKEIQFLNNCSIYDITSHSIPIEYQIWKYTYESYTVMQRALMMMYCRRSILVPKGTFVQHFSFVFFQMARDRCGTNEELALPKFTSLKSMSGSEDGLDRYKKQNIPRKSMTRFYSKYLLTTKVKTFFNSDGEKYWIEYYL